MNEREPVIVKAVACVCVCVQVYNYTGDCFMLRVCM